MRIHWAFAYFVMALAFLVRLSPVELAVLLLAIALVLAAELVNTALEATVDVAVDGFDEKAGVAKDVAAAAVLLSSMFAVGVGICVFGPRLQHFPSLLSLIWRTNPAGLVAAVVPSAGLIVSAFLMERK